jgi:hypothetical protein
MVAPPVCISNLCEVCRLHNESGWICDDMPPQLRQVRISRVSHCVSCSRRWKPLPDGFALDTVSSLRPVIWLTIGRYYGKPITDVDGFKKFWTTLAAPFKDNPRVLWDTNNECKGYQLRATLHCLWR